MNQEVEIQDAIENAIRSIMRNAITVEGTINSVNNNYTVDVQVGGDNGSIFRQVPMAVLIGTQASVIQIPVLGTDCLMKFIDNSQDRPVLVRVDKVAKYLIGDGTTKVQTIFNGGQLGGMVKAKELQTQSNLDKAILTALLQVLTGPPIDEPGNGAPSALQTALRTVLSGKVPGSWDDLENPLITQ